MGLVRLLLSSLMLASLCSSEVASKGPPEIDENEVKPSTTPSNAEKSAQILFVAPFGSKSHKKFYSGIIKALARDGHKVTVLTSFKSLSSTENVDEIVYDWSDSDRIFSVAVTDGFLSATLDIMEKGPEFCFAALASLKTKEILKKKFDLIFVSMFFNECFMGALHSLKVPFVLVNPGSQHGIFSSWRAGNPHFSSLKSNLVLGYEPPLTFTQRLVAALYEGTAQWMVAASFDRVDATGHSLGLFPSDSPSTWALTSNASLVIVNEFRFLGEPAPYMPNVIPLGGIHCRPPRPLKKDLEEWIQGAGSAGFIFFSFGSVVPERLLALEKVRSMFAALKRLKQRVVWKFDASVTDLAVPPNVRLVKKAPQQDLLGHPKIRLFLTEGSLQNVQEAAYHGVPVLGIPFFGEQEGNTARVQKQGWGKQLRWEDLTEESLAKTLQDMLADASIADAARLPANLAVDAPLTAAEEIGWWTKYLLKTSGAPHLRSPAVHVRWYELHNVDVWVCIITFTMIATWLALKCLCCVFCSCCRNRQPKISRRKKRN